MVSFRNYLNRDDKPIIIFDGGTGTSFQNLNLSSHDFGGDDLEGCNENLVLSSPNTVEQVHNSFLEAGCHVIETNTFGASSIVLDEYSISNKAYEINKKAAQIAKKCANLFSSINTPRFVAGSIGPTTKLPTLGHISFDKLKDSYEEQINGLIDGGIDLLLIETCQDVLQIKSALSASQEVIKNRNIELPIMISITMETTGTMLVGSDIASALTILEPYNIDILGLNCATGPVQMKEHIKYLAENSPFAISCIPNAGLPENIGGVAHYKLTPLELKMQLMNFIYDFNVQLIGGCCGTTPEHIKHLSSIIEEIVDKKINKRLPTVKTNFVPSAASIYNAVPYKQDNSILIVGERLNASGSKKVRELLNEDDWDGLLSIAKQQQKENAHILDVNVDYVGRDGVKDMKEITSRLVTNINLPLMIDSTEADKMESGLKTVGGKCIINSTNYEDGDDRFNQVLRLALDYGAGIVIGTIDEDGMARTSQKKYDIAKRALIKTRSSGLADYEIFFDPLALPISTGIEEDRLNAKATIEAISKIRKSFPDIHIILGISNISFGLSPLSRINLNSIFLDECIKAGLDSAIIAPNKILPLSKISAETKKLCLDLIYDRRNFENEICIYDPLVELTKAFQDITISDFKKGSTSNKNLTLEEKLKNHIVDGEKIGLEEQLNNALKKYKPLEIINTYLLDGMKVVGELFGSGQMQLPFVLQSAETMKFAVSVLEPHMETVDEKISNGKLLIATVKGDVHDIGKNLVDIILSNNGFDVINLGIKQDVSAIIDAQKKHKADCIAMSGLLVKSTAFMKDNLEAFNNAEINVPVILGGAALTPKFVNEDCSQIYKGKILYGKDAFTDLQFMNDYMDSKKKGNWSNENGFTNTDDIQIKLASPRSSAKDKNLNKNFEKTKSIQLIENFNRSNFVEEEEPIKAPFLGTRVLQDIEIDFDKLIFYLDKKALFSGQWQIKKNKGQSVEEYNNYLDSYANPLLEKWINIILDKGLISPKVVYGYFRCGRNDNSIYLFDNVSNKRISEFNFPRQKSGNNLCIADFYCDLKNNDPVDIFPMQAVTMGEIASEYSQELFKADKYSDYLIFHGLTVQLAEALAEYVHSIVRIECGFKSYEPNNNRDILAQKYRGARYSFGYPACPKVSDSNIQLSLLDTKRINLTMDESEQLHPEQSTTAIISLHSKAKYFSA
ncbi:putative methionine synthase [Prochlorococcus marinus subsp. pastoris str. CCMP1986]|uniref:Methionine synthase n=1 Tax=Prochlorococcus marinus subsp. pastoris (strain CCMP1986 / NIES-2087 / MED4) TaxID=59919 RepID=Q7V1J3_PROMP|nr:methionine synthase [Prochlorococcus marinus]KGF87559.1 5-methyltetrahydrofolate--homocysteine methyltransferase [Prochlorococcus marinus str. EQPAC1]CAE19336.1 putative methionine synthase [Prochlorococcus marinus subsp. pastoris str. CCMP1986]